MLLKLWHKKLNNIFVVVFVDVVVVVVVVVVVGGGGGGVKRVSLCVSARRYRSTQLTANLWPPCF